MNRENSHAFTLLELMIVLLIIALGSAIIIPQINTQQSYFSSHSRVLLSKLKHFRRQAVIQKRAMQVSIFPGDAKQQKSPDQHWYAEKITFKWKDAQQTISNSPFKIEFFPQGGATGGELFLQLENHHYRLTIDPFTGKISLDDKTTNEP